MNKNIVDDQTNSRKKSIQLLLNKEVIYQEKTASICSICLGSFKNPIVTSCGHKYCWDCINDWYISNKHECPQCRTHLSLSDTTLYKKRDDEKISKFTKPVKLIHPAVSSDSRHFGGTILENDFKDKPNRYILIGFLVLIAIALFVHSIFTW